MIRSLRTRHRLFFWILTPLLLAVFFVGLLARRPIPVMTELPEPLATPIVGQKIWERTDLWPDLLITTRLFAGGNGDVPVVELEPGETVAFPDVLVYWSENRGSETSSDRALPVNAVLLGGLSGTEARRFPIRHAQGSGAELILYSLAHQRVVGRADLPGPKGAEH